MNRLLEKTTIQNATPSSLRSRAQGIMLRRYDASMSWKAHHQVARQRALLLVLHLVIASGLAVKVVGMKALHSHRFPRLSQYIAGLHLETLPLS
jgi:hypothetical protein